jgi:hypothetical protein
MNHLTVNKLLKSCQHGFVKKKACVTNLLETMDFLTLAKKCKITIDILFLDFAKAFDKVSHKLLLFKLEHYGIRGQLLIWIGAFLGSRRQRVILGESSSAWIPVTSGVPQGSVLGPTLFIIYVNDLPDHITSTCKMYADDTKILASAKTEAARSKIQDDLDEVTNWTYTWKMELNAKKCKVMHVGAKSAPLYDYHILERNLDGSSSKIILEKTTSERDLGVEISSNLKSSTQCEKAAIKAN